MNHNHKSKKEILEQLADLSKVKAAAMAYGEKDFASRTALRSIAINEAILLDELSSVESFKRLEEFWITKTS